MPTHGYKFYLWVFNSISHEWVRRASEILSWTQEDIIHIHKRACNIVYYINILMTTFLTIFRRFLTTFWRFPKIFQNCTEGQINASEHFWTFYEDCRSLPKTTEEEPKKSQRCFNHTSTNLSVVKGTKGKCYQKAGHNMSIISIVDKNQSLSIEFDTNQSTNIRCW